MNQSYKNLSPSSSPLAFPATVSSSSSSPPDEISLFLQQFLLRTSSSSSHAGKQQHCSFLSSSPSIFSELTCNFRAFTTDNNHPFYYGDGNDNGFRDEISAVDSSEVVNYPGSYLRPTENDNENDEFDCESEEGLEAALEEELPSKRNNTKRSRAAEVHNLSEKRRRSRINEKMKALQNLIPNSNKTDKASMLDEAIEYLKQLQLQVQMLTMRNGLSLHPMSLPGSLQYLQLSHMRMNFGEENSSLPTDQERPTQILFSLPDQRTPSNHQLTAGIEKIDAENPFELQPSIRTHFVPFNMSESTKEICGEDVLRCRRVGMNQSKTFEFEMGSMAEAELQNGDPVDRGIPVALTQEGLHQVKH